MKLRDEGALKTFTLFLLGFILMAGLQALEAYLDIKFLYQTDTFDAPIRINTCVSPYIYVHFLISISSPSFLTQFLNLSIICKLRTQASHSELVKIISSNSKCD